MAVSERIRHIRKIKALTLKELGQAVGFPELHVDIRISQYESGSRIPRQDILEKLAASLDVSIDALNVPGIDNNLSLLFTLFAMEDVYGFKICRSGTLLYLIAAEADTRNSELHEMLLAWSHYAEMYKDGKISREEYDHWRYNFSLDAKENTTRKGKPKATKTKHKHGF